MATVTINVFFDDALTQVTVDVPAEYANDSQLFDVFADGVGAGVAGLMKLVRPDHDLRPAPRNPA